MKFFKEPKFRENQYLAMFAINGTTEELNKVERNLNDYFRPLLRKEIPCTCTISIERQNMTIIITSSDQSHVQYWKNYFQKIIK